MDFILDNPETDKRFQFLLKSIQARKNGDVADAMKRQGIVYKLNWGVSIIDLRQIAKQVQPDHLLALKLWNKQWRETMILATLTDEPEKVTEKQMDYWTKNFTNTEIAEHASANLWVKSKFAFIKALEWCRGKKHLVRFTGVHLIGRLAKTDKKAIDEMFEPFFGELATLAKDKNLYTSLYRTTISLGRRNRILNEKCIELSEVLRQSNIETTTKLGEELHNELVSGYHL